MMQNKVRVIVFEVEGGDSVLQDSMRAVLSAIGIAPPPAAPAPAVAMLPAA
ncbi:MAG: hypothetical protein IT489_03210, partial [Gammaproteobacteria bacterium]|nr:hypothetical protein [Gammaproteobacteria bacterium]